VFNKIKAASAGLTRPALPERLSILPLWTSIQNIGKISQNNHNIFSGFCSMIINFFITINYSQVINNPFLFRARENEEYGIECCPVGSTAVSWY